MDFHLFDNINKHKKSAYSKVLFISEEVKNYFIGCTAAILVYDITNKNTFKTLKDFWYNEIIKFNTNISMYK